MLTIKITPNDKGNPPGKLADAELHFTDGPLSGLKLIGFAIWERAVAPARRHVPARRMRQRRAPEPRCSGRHRPPPDASVIRLWRTPTRKPA